MPRIPGPSVVVSRIVVLLSYCWFTTPAVADEDDPLEFLNAMMAAHEMDVSGTMSLVLSATVDNPDPDESEIASRVQLQETALRTAMASARTEQQRKVYQAAIAANAATVAEQVRNNADFELFGAFDRIGPFLGGDEKMSFQIRYGDQPEPAVRLDVIQRFLSASNVTSITYDVRARTCVIGTNAVGFGIPNPAVLGRLNPGMIDQLRTASGALASDDGTQTTSPPKLRVEIESQPHGIRLLRCGHDGRVLLECDVDIDKRYLCRRMATFGDNGQPAMLAEFRHFFQTPDGGVWFPGFAKYTTYGDAEAGVLSVIEIKLDAAASTASPRVIDSDLMIHLPGGTSVVSTQPGEESTERFELVCSVDVSIDQAWELAEHKCSSQPLPAVDVSRTALGAGEGSRVWWIIGINIAVVVVAAVCGLCFRRRKQRHSDAVDRAGHLLIAATLGFGVAGCSDTVTSATVSAAGAGAAPVKSIAVVPDRINFGRVAAGPQNTLVAFRVINNSDRLQSATSHPGAGACRQREDR